MDEAVVTEAKPAVPLSKEVGIRKAIDKGRGWDATQLRAEQLGLADIFLNGIGLYSVKAAMDKPNVIIFQVDAGNHLVNELSENTYLPDKAIARAEIQLGLPPGTWAELRGKDKPTDDIDALARRINIQRKVDEVGWFTQYHTIEL